MKNVYEPDNEDILEWINAGGGNWPASDWDYYVMNGKNDSLVFQLANDVGCKEQEFFVHSLYYLVGDYFNSKENPKKLTRINNLLSMVNDESCIEVISWKNKTEKLMNNEIEFDPIFWMNFFL